MAAWSSPMLAWRSRTWRTTSGRTTAQPSPARPVAPLDQLALEGQQLRGRVAVDAQPAVAAHPHRPLGQEPLSGRLDLGERPLSGWGRPAGAWPGRPPRPSG